MPLPKAEFRHQVKTWMEQHKDVEPTRLADLAAYHFDIRTRRYPKWMEELAHEVSDKGYIKPKKYKPRRGTKRNPFALHEKVRHKMDERKVGEIVSSDTGNLNMSWERAYSPMFYMVRWNNGVEEMYSSRDLVSLDE